MLFTWKKISNGSFEEGYLKNKKTYLLPVYTMFEEIPFDNAASKIYREAIENYSRPLSFEATLLKAVFANKITSPYSKEFKIPTIGTIKFTVTRDHNNINLITSASDDSNNNNNTNNDNDNDNNKKRKLNE